MSAASIELELFRHLLVSIADEMGVVLKRSSYSANIKERRDYSCAVYDARGETVAMGDHMPVHLGAMPLSVRAVMESLDLRPGDVALVNDPFRGGTHLPDITAVAGAFLGGSRRPAFYLANRAHHADVGGMSPGSMPMAREIYQEGIRIPPLRIQRSGKIDKEILGLLLANVRTPVEREGDLMAQLASLTRGELRLRELVARYGLRKVSANMRSLQDYSERMMRAAIRALPRRRVSFEDCLDDDGVRPEPVWIRLDLSIADEVVVDFSRSDPQAEGPVNANYAVTVAAVMYVFRCLVEEEIPLHGGNSPADSGDCAGRHGGECAGSGGDGGGQRGDVAAHYRRVIGRAGAGYSGSDSGGVQRDDEQFELRRLGRLAWPGVCVLRNHRGRHGGVVESGRAMRDAHAHDQ